MWFVAAPNVGQIVNQSLDMHASWSGVCVCMCPFQAKDNKNWKIGGMEL